MPAASKLYDRVKNFRGGMNAYDYAADLPDNQSQLLSNMIVLDNGRAVTRPGMLQIDSNPTTFTNINPTGIVQGLGFLDNFTNGSFIILAEGGKLYKWNGSTWSTALSFTLTNATSAVAMCQGADTMLISDGVKGMQYYDGSTFTAASTGAADTNAGHAPTGVQVIAYIAGMYVCAGAAMVQGTGSGTQTFAPDALVFSNYLPTVPVPGTTPSANWANATNSFRVGNGDGEPIIGLAALQSTASTFPTYNLAVLKGNSIWVVTIAPASFPSSGGGYFANMFAQFSATPQGDQVGTGIGCVGSKAYCVYQNDLLFMSTYGVQSLQRMQAAAGQYQLTTPLSLPIQPYINRINWSMAFNIQAIKYRQYAMFACPLDNSTTNNYLFVWDGLLGQWMIFQGWTPEAFIVSRFNNVVQLVMGDSNGNVSQWLDGPTFSESDSTYFDNGVPIVTTLTTRSFVFKNLEILKKPKEVVFRFNGGNATVNITAYEDNAQEDQWQNQVIPTGAVLPFVLPVMLASEQAIQVYRSLEGILYCNEIWFTLSSTTGWWDIRGLVTTAYGRQIRDPSA